jgi:hypothetical protein
MRNWQIMLCACANLSAVGCTSASADTEAARWLRIVRDANYDVAIDTSRVRGRIDGSNGRWYPSNEVWYRTDHHIPRLHNDKPFNREVVQSIVQCDSLWFKVISVDMSMGNERPISQQRTAPNELPDQPWRRVVRGTAEEIAAKAACHFAAKRQLSAVPVSDREKRFPLLP